MFLDRTDAGEKLAKKLLPFKNQEQVLVCALPRGGVGLGHAIANLLQLPLLILAVKKIGAPNNPEYAIGAVSETGEFYLDETNAAASGATDIYLRDEKEKMVKEAKRRAFLYRRGKEFPDLTNQTIILVDDGIATGHTIRASIKCLKKKNAAKIVLASPVAPKSAAEELAKEVDHLVILEKPAIFFAVGNFYASFGQVSDQQIEQILKNG